MVAIEVKEECRGCNGTGTAKRGGNPPNSIPCPDCGGSGYIVIMTSSDLDDRLQVIEDKVDDVMDKCNDILEQVSS